MPDHLRRDRGLVDKDEARRPQLGLLGYQRGALGSDVRPLLFGCVQCFLRNNDRLSGILLLQNKAKCFRASVEIVQDTLPVTLFVIARPGISV